MVLRYAVLPPLFFSILSTRPVPAAITFTGTCDGSAAVALDPDHFLDLNDESNAVRVYDRRGGAEVQSFDPSSALGLASSDEGDFEDAARVGDRVYVIGSHGRTKDGALAPARGRFFGMDLGGTTPALSITVAGSYDALLDDMLDDTRWVTPDASAIAALAASTGVGIAVDDHLAPEAQGTNIEGLAAFKGGLAIGFRNPGMGDRALVVTLENPDDVLHATVPRTHARLGRAYALDLGDRGVRGMTWSTEHDAMLILAGPRGGSGAFALYRWSGEATDAPSLVTDIAAPKDSAPEAIVATPGSLEVLVVFDQGGAAIGRKTCKKAAPAAQQFSGIMLRVPRR